MTSYKMYIKVDKRFVMLMALSLVTNHIQLAELAINNNMESQGKSQKNASSPDTYYQINHDNNEEKSFDPLTQCGPSSIECHKLAFPCIKCNYNTSCIYGEDSQAICEVRSEKVECVGPRQFTRQFQCRYCFLTEQWEHICMPKTNCHSAQTLPVRTNCTVYESILCLGNRTFMKNVKCNWTRGYRWSTALIISITLGGFGVDRFYLGHWQEGIGKLFSFGGLGVWTLIDSILISIGFLGASDGSHLL